MCEMPRLIELTTPGSHTSSKDSPLLPELESKTEPELGHDSSTNGLIRRYRQLKEKTL